TARASVLAMDANHPAILCGSLQGIEDAGIVQHEHAGVSHEKLKAGNALAHQRIHFLQLRIAQLSNNAMKCIIADCFLRRLLHPRIKSRSQKLSFVLDSEINQRCRSAKCRRSRASLEVVGAGSAADRHVQMGMDMNAARTDMLAR